MIAPEHRTADRRPHARLAAGFLALLAFAASAPCSHAGDGAKARNVAVANADSDEVTSQEGTAPATPAGMVFVPGGEYPIGMDEKAFREFLKTTSFDREMKNTQETGWNEQLSTSTPAWTANVAPYWIGRWEVTNAQWAHFLETAGRVEITVGSDKVDGPRTLTDIARLHLLVKPFKGASGKQVYVEALSWEQIYDINEDLINPSTDSDGNPRKQLPKEHFRDNPLFEGTRILTYRWSLPSTWKNERFKQQTTVPIGMEDHPVTDVSLVDAMAFAAYYGCHIPTEVQWEVALRGPEGHLFPEGEFDPLAHAWRGFNEELRKAKVNIDARIEDAKRRLDKEREGGNQKRIDAAEAEWNRLFWIRDAQPLPDQTVSVLVGGFQDLDASWCGAHDMLGNVDEWTSNTLFKYDGSKSPSTYFVADAHVLRGGNLFDPDTVLHALFRKFIDHGPIRRHFKFTSGGFRVARYAVPGASAATAAVLEVSTHRPAILPGAYDRKHKATYVGLDLGNAVGIEQLHEWQPRTADDLPPQGKVFYLGQARSLAVVPAAFTPFNNDSKLKKAADKAARDPKKKDDSRLPMDIPFLGLVHMTPGLVLKGQVQQEDGTWAKGTIRSEDHPRGLLLGWAVYGGEERRPVLWEARTSSLGGAAPGGFILLEKPLMLLDPGALKLDDESLKDFIPKSKFDADLGLVELDFIVPYGDPAKARKGAHCTLTLTLGDFEPWEKTHGQWQTAGGR